MGKKALYILLFLVVALALMIGGITWWNKREGKGRGAHAVVQALQRVDFARVNTIEIKKGGDDLTIVQEGGLWRVEGKRADAKKVREALDALRTSSFQGPLSRKPENIERLGVGGEGLSVSLGGDATHFSFIVGKRGPVFESSYVRLESSDEVFLANTDLPQVFPVTADVWRSKTIVDIDPVTVAAVEYRTRGELAKTYRKEGETWQVIIGATSTTTDSTTVKKLLDVMHLLKASGFVDGEKERDAFERERVQGVSVTVLNSSGAAVGEMIFLKKKDIWWVRAKGDDQVYTLSSSLAAQLELPTR
ncbi:MAG: DUF4340 domain-containing protein [Patescibacteria group bacterium]